MGFTFPMSPSTETFTTTAAKIVALTGKTVEQVTDELIAKMIAERPSLLAKIAREAGLA